MSEIERIAEALARGEAVGGRDNLALSANLASEWYWQFGIYFACALIRDGREDEALTALEQVMDRAIPAREIASPYELWVETLGYLDDAVSGRRAQAHDETCTGALLLATLDMAVNAIRAARRYLMEAAEVDPRERGA